MDFEDYLGTVATLWVRRMGSPGAFLAATEEGSGGPEEPVILLPGTEMPVGTKAGDELDVFIYRDSEDRLIATSRTPKLALGEVVFLEVTDLTPFGAFVDWGLAKELLVPKAEQTRDLRVGDRQPIGLFIDESGRLAGTMKVSEMLALDVDRSQGAREEYARDEWVEGEAWRNEPEVGLFVIVERTRVGLVPASEPHSLSRGEAARFRVTHRHGDGKIELSLRAPAHLEMEGDAIAILRLLRGPKPPRLGDRSDPELIRDVFGLSKKAFKRAVGRLLRDGRVTLDRDGMVVAVGDGEDSSGEG